MRDCSAYDFDLFRISRGEWAPLVPSRLHLLVCPTCRERVSELRNVSTLLEAVMVAPKRASRLSAPVAGAIIACGVFAIGTMVHQVRPNPTSASAKLAPADLCGDRDEPNQKPPEEPAIGNKAQQKPKKVLPFEREHLQLKNHPPQNL